jgi:hypothetical protein
MSVIVISGVELVHQVRVDVWTFWSSCDLSKRQRSELIVENQMFTGRERNPFYLTGARSSNEVWFESLTGFVFLGSPFATFLRVLKWIKNSSNDDRCVIIGPSSRTVRA